MMMEEQQRLPDELAWREDGHASDLVITALADGERDIVPLEAFTHVHGCRLCGERLGQAALLATEVDEAVQVQLELEAEAEQAALAERVSGEIISAPRRLPLPVPALAAALVLAGVGAAPTLAELSTQLPQLIAAAVSNLPVLLSTAWLMVRSALTVGGPALTAAWGVAALVLLLTGVMIARLLPVPARAKGELR